MSHSNAWSNPSAVGAEDVARMAAFLEERASCPDQAQVNAALRDVVAGRPGERVLEVGCGSGALCRLVAPDLQPDGEMVGADVAPDMIAAAQQYVHMSPLATLAARERGGLRFEVASGEQLPYGDATFDAAFAARLLLHVADPLAVTREMARVVRPGGRVVLMDWDFETLAVDHPDRALTRRLLHWRCDNHGGDNWSGRKLLGYAAAAGLGNLRVFPVVTIARDETAALTGTLWRAAEVARDRGGITPEEHDAWLGELQRQLVAGWFLASIVYFIVRGDVERFGTGRGA
jgi:ubiquinone/menaquinone biosynthesis C-methylase UbiE